MTRLLFWDVDTQHDFMRADGLLYVPGSEEIIPALKALTDYAHAHGHPDPGQRRRPRAGAPGAERHARLPDHLSAALHAGHPGPAEDPGNRARAIRWSSSPSRGDAGDVKARVPKHDGDILLHKHWFDVFTNGNIGPVLDALDPERVVLYGVALDVCDRYAVEGLLQQRPKTRLSLVTDAVRAIHAEAGARLLKDWAQRGVKMVTTADVLRGVA